MGRINNWFEKKALESLARKPWKMVKMDYDLEHLKKQVSALPGLRRFFWYFGAFLVFFGIVVVVANLSGGLIIQMGMGVIIILLGIWAIIQGGIDSTRSLIAHERMLAAYSEVEFR